MGALMRAFDWRKTPLGSVDQWPVSLRTMVALILGSRFPMMVGWGAGMLQLYNDGYREILGDKHPQSLAQRARECWAEIWDKVGPLLQAVLNGETATWSEDLLLEMNRYGFVEETHFTACYSPISIEDGIGGVLVTCYETTVQVHAARQLKTLRELATISTEAKTVEAACVAAARVLEGNPADLPFALIYLEDPDGGRAKLTGTAGFERHSGRAVADFISLERDETDAWPLASIRKAGTSILVDDLAGRFGAMPSGSWSDASRSALIMPLRRAGSSYGFLVVGISPRRRLNDGYRDFLELVADQIVAAIASANAYQGEKRRAEALAEIDRAKTAFFSNVSHEFRTPLTLILGPLEDAIAASREPAASESLRIAHRNAMRLLRLVNSLLDFSRIEARRVQASFEPVDLAQFTRELASAFESLMERAGLSFTIECEPLSEPAHVDREMWEKVVLNLVSNAFKFTFEGGVSVELRQAADRIELSVGDTGCGIPEHELPRLFERFHRVAGARSRTYEGSGIGLALVNELVKMHGGEIRVTSTIDRGSTFIVSIPAGRAHLPQDRIGAARTLAPTAPGAAAFVDEASRWLAEEERATRLTQDVGEPLEFSAPPADARILVVDDNADMRDYVKRLLERHYQVETAADGNEALRVARSKRPDLVLTDVMMPHLGGFGFLRELRKDPVTRSIPVIMLSARAGEESKIEGLERGADDYLIKPFPARELVAKVQAHINLARLREQSQRLLREGEERLALAAAAAGIGIYEWDVSRDRMVWDRRVFELFGRPPEQEPVTLKEFLERFIHPDDAEEFQRQLWRGIRSGEVFHTRSRIRRQNDGAVRWLEWHARTFGFADSRPARVIGVIWDITENIRALQAEREAREEAERARGAADQANRTKDEFLAMLGHELRNPLSPILTALKIMQLRNDGTGARERGVIERQVNRLAELIDDLLDISRITRGKIELRKRRVELATVVADAIEMASPLIERRGHHLEIQAPSSGLHIEADPTRLAQVVSNLLTNAARYTDPGGRVVVSGRREGAEVTLRVRDNGIGIRPDFLPSIFDLFTQGPRPLDRNEGGLGIGLALVRGLVALHGGSVSAHSEGPGKGSEFVVRLPAAPASVQDASDSIATKTAIPEGSASLRVMVIDDNQDAAETLAALLDSYGHVTRTLFDGPSALEAAAEFRPDVLLVDIGLPVMDGYELARRLREIPQTASARIIAITGYGQDSDRRRTADAGFDAHLVKPVNLETLQSLLQSA